MLPLFGEPVSAKTPPASKFGGPKPIVPTNGDPSLMTTVYAATTAPRDVVSGTWGVFGATVITTAAGGGGGGGGGALGVTILTAKVADPLNLVLDPMARIRTE